MHRNLYDTDCSVWSPEGRVFQSEYACEAVKQGNCAIGIKSKTHAVLCGLQKASSPLSSHNNKITKIDDHIGLAFSGIVSDGRTITNLLRTGCLRHEYLFGEKVPVEDLMDQLAAKSQDLNIRDSGRPFGVGCLVISGHPDTGRIRLYETSPTGEFYEYYAQAFGSRCQSANTFLDNHLSEFPDMGADDLVKMAVSALRKCLPQDGTLEAKFVQVAVVSGEDEFRILTNDEVAPVIELVMKEVAPEEDEEEELPLPDETAEAEDVPNNDPPEV